MNFSKNKAFITDTMLVSSRAIAFNMMQHRIQFSVFIHISSQPLKLNEDPTVFRSIKLIQKRFKRGRFYA